MGFQNIQDFEAGKIIEKKFSENKIFSKDL